MASKARTPINKQGPAAKPLAQTVAKAALNIKKPVLSKSITPETKAQPITATKGTKPAKPSAKKPKLVRAKFAFPKSDHALLGALKKRASAAGRKVKKSALLRAGLALLNGMSDAELVLELSKIKGMKARKSGKGKSPATDPLKKK
jgi:hypothetical protein